MSVEEERAALLRTIARTGYSIYDDTDGSTANTLYEMAEALAPIMGTTVPKAGTARRWWLRLRFRLKARWLGLIPALAILWATVEVRALSAQTANDSLYALPWVREQIGEWRPQWRVWCLTRHADYGTLLLIVSVAPPDTATQCTRPEGGSYPLVVDLPECPRGELVPTAAPFMLTRCNSDGWQRFPSKPKQARTI